MLLRDSGKPWNLFNMGGAGERLCAVGDSDCVFDARRLQFDLSGWLQSGAVSMRVSLNGNFSEGPSDAAITVAEIKGSEFPDERVIIGGHLDSWDLGQGALDNGTGAMSVLEAARTLKTLGWKPKRTITFILFTGEEEGGVGVQNIL